VGDRLVIALGLIRFVIALWFVVIIFGYFTTSSAIDGQWRDAREAAIPVAILLAVAIPYTRSYLRRIKRELHSD
jgi:hypothetical protein